jgi:hypothetical protein
LKEAAGAVLSSVLDETGSNQCVFDLERRAAEERTGIELRAAKEHDWKTTGPFACTGQDRIGGR